MTTSRRPSADRRIEALEEQVTLLKVSFAGMMAAIQAGLGDPPDDPLDAYRPSRHLTVVTDLMTGAELAEHTFAAIARMNPDPEPF